MKGWLVDILLGSVPVIFTILVVWIIMHISTTLFNYTPTFIEIVMLVFLRAIFFRVKEDR